MANYAVTSDARRDLTEILLYIEERSGTRMAGHVERRFFKAFDEIARMPGLGFRRRDVRSERFLFWTVFDYLIAFERTTPVMIHRVIHGARDLPQQF